LSSIREKFSVEEVRNHNKPSDCFVIFENKVYDITKYIESHDKFMDIRGWCGENITKDFKTKAGLGRDHKKSTYNTLEKYYIGDLDKSYTESSSSNSKSDNKVESENNSKSNKKTKTPIEKIEDSGVYIVSLSIFLFLLYVSERTITKKSKNEKLANFVKKYRKLLWNTLLLIFSVPSIVFGVFLTLRIFLPNLYNIKFDFLFWHTFGSILFSEVSFLHIAERLWFFRSFLRRKKSNPSSPN